VKRSGRDEPMQVIIHKCREATLGISLYSYLYLKLSKMLCLSYYPLCFLFNKIEEEVRTGMPGSEGDEERGRETGKRGEVAQTMYTHMNKCINNLERSYWKRFFKEIPAMETVEDHFQDLFLA
jgi:hypothetical protein